MDNANTTPPTVLSPRKSPTYESMEELVTFHIGKGLLKKTFVVHKELPAFTRPSSKLYSIASSRRERPKPTSWKRQPNVLSDF
jgi:hypothetical protein